MYAIVLAKRRSPTDRVATGSGLTGAADGAGVADAVGSGAGVAADADEGSGGGDITAEVAGAAAAASLGGAAPPPQAVTMMAVEMSTTRKLRGLFWGTLSSVAPFMSELYQTDEDLKADRARPHQPARVGRIRRIIVIAAKGPEAS